MEVGSTVARTAAAAALIVLVAGAPSSSPRADAASARTIVSLTFDDGRATEYTARSLLSSHGMNATFYVNSSKLGTDSDYMTWSQVDALAADGNEIGGHTAFHVDLPRTDPTEAKREVCNDRVNLVDRGYSARSFAYPFGAFNAAAETVVSDCGFNSARTTNQFVPPPSETIPPQDPYAIRVAGSAGSGISPSKLESYVTKVEQTGGGWAPLVFHQICNACDPNAISQSDLAAFLDWLQPRAANGTIVKTVGDVIGGTVKPPVNGPAAPPPPNGTNALRNSSLERLWHGNIAPDCWDFDSWGNNTYDWSRTTDAHTGSYAVRVDVSRYVNGDSKLVGMRDLGYCTPSVRPGHRYRITAWYRSSRISNYVAFTRDSLGAFHYWATSGDFAAASTWTHATWVTPVIPSGVNGVSFGLAIAGNGFLTVDDLGLDDASPNGVADTTPPIVSLTAPGNGATVAGTVTLSANASDTTAVDHVDVLVDGTVVGTTSSGVYSHAWDSRAVENGTHTITVRAVDTAGNAATSAAVRVTAANSTVNLLQNPSLETAVGSTPTCWKLGGFGTNTYTWTRTTDAHSGSYAEALHVTSFSDGDRKLVSTQDSGACAPAVTPGRSYTVSAYYKANATARIFAFYRSSAGIWTYWTSMSFPASSRWARASFGLPAVPRGATNLFVGLGLSAVGSVTMDDFSLSDDAALDTTAPTSSISCDSATCSSGRYKAAVSVSLGAADTGGSGLKEIRYTIDGSGPTASTGTVYKGPFSVGSTTTVKYRAFDDAFNAGAIKSRLIRIDTRAPTVAITTPTNGSGVSGNVRLTASASDTGSSGIASVTFYLDGKVLGLATAATSQFTLQWNTKETTKGPHSLTAVAQDRAGNATTSAAVTVTVT